VQIGRGQRVRIEQRGGESVAVLQTPSGTRVIPIRACENNRVGRTMLRLMRGR
jgi:hypothetical protein